MGSTPLLLSEGDCLPHGTKEEYPCATCEHTPSISENIPPAGPEASSAPVLPDERGAAVGAPDDKGEPTKQVEPPLAFAGGGQGAGILIHHSPPALRLTQ